MSGQNAESTTRFIIITVPPPSISGKLEKLIADCSIIGDSYEAISYPPHITLRTGALVPEKDIRVFVDGFQRHCASLSRVKITTSGVYFDTYLQDSIKKYFIGYHILKTERLIDIHRELMTYDPFIKKNKQNEFTPHLSLAYHDLGEASFIRLKDYITANPDTYGDDYSWDMENVSLYVKKGEKWEPFYIHKLK